ncbi:hypothetical protein DFJ74DRAFT_187636 [Hyaloraphidium curvatum]|nr:hypothetical protein DFJ74DRAFT_187636 [Hyaloraphidium curvatum]
MDEKNHEVHAEEVRKFLGDKPSTDAMLQNGVNMVNAARASKGLKPQTASQIWGKGEDTDDDSEEDNTAPNKSGAASRKKRKGKGGKGKGKGKQGNASDDDARDASDIDSDYDVKLDTSHPCNKGLIRMLRSLDSNADHTKCRCETQFGKQKGARVSDKKLKNLSSSAISTLYPVPPDEAQSSNNDAISKALSNLPADAHARRDAVRARLEGAAVVAEHARNANEISDQHDDALGFVRGVNNACRQSIQAVQMCRLALDATGRSSWSSFMRKGHSATEKEIEVEDWVISWLIAEGYLPETTQTGWSRRSSFRKKVNGMLRFHALAIGYGYRIHLLLDKHIFYTNLEYISDEFFEQWCNLAMAKLENVSNVKAHEQVKELHHRVQVRLASISKKLEAKWAGEMSQRFTNLFSKGPYSNVPILERS